MGRFSLKVRLSFDFLFLVSQNEKNRAVMVTICSCNKHNHINLSKRNLLKERSSLLWAFISLAIFLRNLDANALRVVRTVIFLHSIGCFWFWKCKLIVKNFPWSLLQVFHSLKVSSSTGRKIYKIFSFWQSYQVCLRLLNLVSSALE